MLQFDWHWGLACNGLEIQEGIGLNGPPWWLSGEEPAFQCRRHGFNPWVRKIPWIRKWQHTPVFLPGKSHGQRSLVGYRPWGGKESDTTERLNSLYAFNQFSESWDDCFCSIITFVGRKRIVQAPYSPFSGTITCWYFIPFSNCFQSKKHFYNTKYSNKI